MLYLVATPIGNLEDISKRAVRLLDEADYILAEDTRKAGLLCKHFSLPKKKFISFYDHNEKKRIPQVLSLLQENKTILLISRAGTPLISDPGFLLVQACIEQKIPFSVIPGPSAVTTALVLSGFATDSFVFLGFLPRRAGKIRKKLGLFKNSLSTLILFENPKRLKGCLSFLYTTLGDRKVCIVREMTKIHEEVIRGTISELQNGMSFHNIPGECTVVISGEPAG